MSHSDDMSHSDAILDSMSDGVFTIDNSWKITSFNRAAERITGVSRQEAMGNLCSDVFKSNMCETECALRSTFKTGKPIINRYAYIINSNKKRIPVSISSSILRDKDGKPTGGVKTFRDLSEVDELKGVLKGRCHIGDLVTHSSSMCKVIELAKVVAASSSTVLISGETGTGKELLAHGIHRMSDRNGKPFIAINCGALPDNLLESELFGYKKGAFTGAVKDKPGRFELAKDGTIFLDEIGEISQALQVRLLRVLQENTFEPLGGIETIKTNARVITATNKNLQQMIKDGKFRQDLYYRIHIVGIELPPLRDRKEDIPYLVDHFISRFNIIQKKNIEGYSRGFLSLLMTHDWAGNVRELENIIERAFVLCTGKQLEASILPATMTGFNETTGDNAPNITSVKRSAEMQTIMMSLERNNFNRLATATELGIHKTTLYRKMKSLGIEPNKT